MEGDNQSLASELLHEVKATSKRWFILFIITLLMLFGTNMAWLYAWNLPTEETTISSDNNSNANYINGEGDHLGEELGEEDENIRLHITRN